MKGQSNSKVIYEILPNGDKWKVCKFTEVTKGTFRKKTLCKGMTFSAAEAMIFKLERNIK